MELSARQIEQSWRRLLPRIEAALKKHPESEIFLARLEAQFPRILRLLNGLYSDQYDFFYHLEQILTATAQMFRERPADLKALDVQRMQNPTWFQSEKMMGGVCYVDLFAGKIKNLSAKIPYFKELGLTYLHLMPLFKAPEADSDGGYAVSDYRTVNPSLGTMRELAAFAAELRENGISLVLDFIFNHTSDEHSWAQKALAGDPDYQDFYLMFDDRTLPDQYSRTLREIFPEQDPGSFTYRPEVQKWVWTTFRRFQWDLNYRNPAVFNAMLQEMLFLANQGVEILRFDAVAFIWKQMGTSCENLPQAHQIIQALNALVQAAAPSMLFKSEAIVHPDEVARYISWEECPISYNPTLMALLWEALATRQVKLLRHSMTRRFDLPQNCAWVNYIRVHDDIGWTFADEDAAEIGIRGYDHRQFLNRFYTGRFEGSFAAGVPFNYNPVNQDMRISGMAASLIGLERAVERDSALLVDHAIRRLLLIDSVILSIGGIPLLYFGDEIAMLNDYRYQNDPAKQEDSRWVHRPVYDWARADQRGDSSTLPGRVFQQFTRLIRIRQQTAAFAGNQALFFDTGSPQVFGYLRSQQILVLANFSEAPQSVPTSLAGHYTRLPERAYDLITEREISLSGEIALDSYQFMWLKL